MWTKVAAPALKRILLFSSLPPFCCTGKPGVLSCSAALCTDTHNLQLNRPHGSLRVCATSAYHPNALITLRAMECMCIFAPVALLSDLACRSGTRGLFIA